MAPHRYPPAPPLQVIETRPYGGAMVRETAVDEFIKAGRELQADGLFEVIK